MPSARGFSPLNTLAKKGRYWKAPLLSTSKPREGAAFDAFSRPTTRTRPELKNLDWRRDAFDALLSNLIEAASVRECIGDDTRNDTSSIVGPRRFLHASSDVYGIPVDADRTLGVALFTDDDVAAVDADSEIRRDAEKLTIGVALARNTDKHCIHCVQDCVVLDGRRPVPHRDQPIALVE